MTTTALHGLDREWLSRQQAAAYLQVSTKTVDKLIAKGKITASKLGDGPKARVRISAESIEKMLGK